jgi:hypothetical protein
MGGRKRTFYYIIWHLLALACYIIIVILCIYGFYWVVNKCYKVVDKCFNLLITGTLRTKTFSVASKIIIPDNAVMTTEAYRKLKPMIQNFERTMPVSERE